MGFPAAAMPWTRAGIGLLQGFCLLALAQASEQSVWPATEGMLFAPLFATAFLIPPLLISGVGNLGWRTLLSWSAIAAVMCAGLAAYDIYRDPAISGGGITFVTQPHDQNVARIFPSSTFWLSAAAILFIVHTLVISGAADRKLLATYQTHFDVSWKHGLQFVLAVLFVGLLWALLFLGAELFRLLRIESFADLIRRKAFWIPITAVAFSYALHISDTRANIVQGARTLTLIVLSWLLPLMAAIGAAFVIALAFTGLEPLWETRHAAGILLTAAAALVFLINAAYQDGRAEHRAATVLRYASVLAAVVLVVLVALAAYGLLLRIRQYGLTPERVGAAACTVIAAGYGVGYLVAAVRSGVQLRGLEQTNVVIALVIVAVLFTLRSPLGDPDRISVANQMHRLETGLVSPTIFDFAFLRFRAGRYGLEALRRLAANKEGPEAAAIAGRAGDALAAEYPFEVGAAGQRAGLESPQIGPEQRARNITVVHPSGATLPKTFLQHDWSIIQRGRYQLPRCLTMQANCDAILTDLDGDGHAEILLLDDQMMPGAAGAFKAGPNDDWEFIGTIERVACPGVSDALKAGHFAVVKPLLKDIEAGGERLRISTPWCK